MLDALRVQPAHPLGQRQLFTPEMAFLVFASRPAPAQLISAEAAARLSAAQRGAVPAAPPVGDLAQHRRDAAAPTRAQRRHDRTRTGPGRAAAAASPDPSTRPPAARVRPYRCRP